jgi:cell division protein FtsQ
MPLKYKHGASKRTGIHYFSRAGLQLWLRRTGVTLVFAVCAYGMYWGGQQLLDSSRFPLRYVYLYGDLQYADTRELKEKLVVYPGQNFFSLDIEQMRSSLIADPWIDQVTVQRRWPDRLVVNMKERRAFAKWGEDELLDAAGRRFRPRSLPGFADWPLLSGPDGHEQLLVDAYLRASEILQDVRLEIDQMVQDKRLAWWLTLANGIRLKLGKDELGNNELLVRLRRFTAHYHEFLADRIDQISAVDMRYPEGFAVVWAESAIAAPTHAEVVAGYHSAENNRLLTIR